MNEYTWTNIGGRVMLNENGKNILYNAESINFALATVKSQRDFYFTEKDWQYQIKKFQDGVDCLNQK